MSGRVKNPHQREKQRFVEGNAAQEKKTTKKSKPSKLKGGV